MNISGSIEAVFLKHDTRNLHHKRNQMMLIVSLPWKLSWLQSLSVKNQISSFSTLEVGQRVMLETEMVTILSYLSSLDWLE